MKIKKQEDIKDCGIYVIQALHHFYYKKWLNINKLKYFAEYEENGISISTFCSLGYNIGLEIEAYKINLEDVLKMKLKFPIITLIKIDELLHYIAIEKITNETIIINDSIHGRRKINFNIFKELFIGIILIIEKTKNYKINNDMFMNRKINFYSNTNFFFTSIFLSVLIVFSNYILSFVNKILFSYIEKNKTNLSLQYLILFFWISITLFISSFFNDLLINKIQVHISNILKMKFMEKIRKADVKQLNKITKNEIIIRYNSIEILSNFLANKLHMISSFIISLSLSISLFVFIKNYIIYIIICFCLLKILIYYFIDKKIKILNRQILQKTLEEINDVSFLTNNQNFTNLHFWDNVRESFFKTNMIIGFKHKKNYNLLFNIKKILNSLTSLINNSIIIFYFIQNSNEPISNLFFIFSAQTLLNNPILLLQEFLINRGLNDINLEKISFILNIPENFVKKSNISIKKIEEIAIQNMSLIYGNNIVFKQQSFVIKKGTKILGKNGSGKSSLIRAISGLNLELKNNIYFNDLPLSKIDSNWLNDNIFYINNDFSFPNTDLYSFLFININKKIVENLLKNENFNYLIKILNISLFSNINYIQNKLSMGQQQIIKLLPLIIRKYKIILLDESFEFLTKKVFKLFKKLIIDFQQTALIIEASHSQRFITKNGDKIVLKNIV